MKASEDNHAESIQRRANVDLALPGDEEADKMMVIAVLLMGSRMVSPFVQQVLINPTVVGASVLGMFLLGPTLLSYFLAVESYVGWCQRNW